MAKGAGAVLRPGRGRRMAGAEPEVDGARKDQAGAAKIAKYTAHEKTKTGTSTRRAG